MVNIAVLIKLGSSQLDYDKVTQFSMSSQITRQPPYGFFKFQDDSSKIINEFNGLAIGTSVNIRIVSTGEKDTKITEAKKDGEKLGYTNDPDVLVEYREFVILGIEDDCSKNPNNYAGTLTIWFGHPWYINRDVEPHCYSPMNATQLIKKILKDEQRGFPILINKDEDLEQTDDKGQLIRYKSAVDDYIFLFRDILPFCSIGQLPAHLYLDEFGCAYLKSFKSMYKQNPVVVIGPGAEDINGEKVHEAIDKLCKKYSIDPDSRVFTSSTVSIKVGIDDLGDIVPAINVENAGFGTYVQGTQIPGNTISKSSDPTSSTFADLMPLDAEYMKKVVNTKVKMQHNRQVDDALVKCFQDNSSLDSFFEMKIIVDYCGAKVKVGDSVEVYVDSIPYSAKETADGKPAKKQPWTRGRWVITRIIHFLDADTNTKLSTQIFIARPTFYGNNQSTALKNTAAFYKAV